MGFDKNTPDKPLMDVEKKTTKVNLWVGAGVLAFILIGILYFAYTHRHSGETQDKVGQQLDRKP